jgi:large subunit ribosomal protein L10
VDEAPSEPQVDPDRGAGRTKGSPRAEKVAVVNEVRERLDHASAAILTEYRGLKVKEIGQLRRSLRQAGGEYRIYKNTLVRLAVAGLDVDGLEQLLTGPTAIAFVDGDAATVAKALRDYARTNPHLVVKGGILGTKLMSAAEATALADLPSREVVLSRLAGALAAPMVQFAGLLQALPRNFAYGLKALVDQRGGIPEPAAAAEPEPAAAEPEPAAAAEPAEPEPAAAAEPAEPEPAAAAEPEPPEPEAPSAE